MSSPPSRSAGAPATRYARGGDRGACGPGESAAPANQDGMMTAVPSPS